MTVFDSETAERKFVPFEIKEAGIKAGVGLIGVNMLSLMMTIDGAYSAISAAFILNYGYTCWKFMGNAVTKIELLDDGKKVNLHFGKWGGKVTTVDISSVKKLKSEKALVETYEESFLFPIQVKDATYYIHGYGQESIKNGEVFRAIVNGENIKL